MQSATVVIMLNEFLQAFAQVFGIAIRASVNLFLFQRLQKALAGSIVVRIARSAHARQHPKMPELLHILSTRVLHTLVRMMNNTRRWSSICKASSKAETTSRALRLRSNPQLMTFRENTSSTTAKYTNSLARRV